MVLYSRYILTTLEVLSQSNTNAVTYTVDGVVIAACSGVGYRVMMRALHEALRERLHIDDDDAERMGRMRFRDMLAEAVRDDPAVNDVSAF